MSVGSTRAPEYAFSRVTQVTQVTQETQETQETQAKHTYLAA